MATVRLSFPDALQVEFLVPGAPPIPSVGETDLSITWDERQPVQDAFEAMLSQALTTVEGFHVVRAEGDDMTLPADIGEKIATALESAGWRRGEGSYLEQGDSGWFSVLSPPEVVSDTQVSLVTWCFWPDRRDDYEKARRAVAQVPLGARGVLIWPEGDGFFPSDWSGPEASEHFVRGSIEFSAIITG